MNNQDFVLKGKHLLHSECEDKEKVLHPRTCTDQVLMEHDNDSAINLFSWITKPLHATDNDYEVCPSLIEWLNTYYSLSGDAVLPLMSETHRGGAKVGNYLTINSVTEKLSVDLAALGEALWENLPIATYSKAGAIIVDNNSFEVNETGKLSLKTATSTTFGGGKLGTALGISEMITIPNNAHFTAFPIGKTSDGKFGTLIPNQYLLSGTSWYLDYYRDSASRHITNPTDSSGNPNGINTNSMVNYILVGNTSIYGEMIQPTMALVAGTGIEFEFNINQGANSFIPTLNFNKDVAEIKIKASFPAATSSVIGGVKLASETPIYESLDQWKSVPESNYDVYPIQLHASGVMGFKLPQASSSVMGGIKLGFTESENNYAVKLDENGQAYVTVPTSSGSYTAGKDITIDSGVINVKAVTSLNGNLILDGTLNLIANDQQQVKYAVTAENGGTLNIVVPNSNRLESTIVLTGPVESSITIVFLSDDTNPVSLPMTQVKFLQNTENPASSMNIVTNNSSYTTQIFTNLVINITKNIVYIYETYTAQK